MGKPQTVLSLGLFQIFGKVQVGVLWNLMERKQMKTFPCELLHSASGLSGKQDSKSFLHGTRFSAMQIFKCSNNLEAQWSILLSGDNRSSNYMRKCLVLLLSYKYIYGLLKKSARNYSCCHWAIISTYENVFGFCLFVCVWVFFCWGFWGLFLFSFSFFFCFYS